MKKIAAIIICVALVAATFCTTGCYSNTSSSQQTQTESTSANVSNNSGNSNANGQNTAEDTAIPAGAIDWSEAGNHVGETVTVYAKVMSTNYATNSNGSPTFLNMGVDYGEPGCVTAVIWGRNRSTFSSAPEVYYENKTLCVTGTISLYEGACQIEVSSPNQIQVVSSVENEPPANSEIGYLDYTDNDGGFTISLPAGWEKKNENSSTYDPETFSKTVEFEYEHGETIAYFIDSCPYNSIDEYVDSSVEYGQSHYTDFTWNMETLSSGYYYCSKYMSSNEYCVNYETVRNGFMYRYEYLAYGGEAEATHLSDFETMVANIQYM